jgi:hypothetical protein
MSHATFRTGQMGYHGPGLTRALYNRPPNYKEIRTTDWRKTPCARF